MRTTAIWVAIDPDERTEWARPRAECSGHGLNIAIQAIGTTFLMLVGCRPIDDRAVPG
jgi:hypothetical protein